jgi:glycosyltransferase involved in cell wall biosynthesis
MIRIDIVTAVRSEESTIPRFVDHVHALDLPGDVEVGILFVEDSSDDGTPAVLRKLAAEDATIRYWCLDRGFGQCPAIVYGMARSRADAIVMLDVDGSHPIDLIPEMIQRFRTGASVVQCRRRSVDGRHEGRNVASSVFGALGRWLTGVDLIEQNVYFRLVSAETARMLVGDSIYWRFLRFPLPSADSGELVILEADMRERSEGESKYDVLRLLAIGLDGILSLMPWSRFLPVAGLALLLILGLVVSGWWPLGMLLLAGLVLSARRYAALRNLDTLDRMHAIESSDPSVEAA